MANDYYDFNPSASTWAILLTVIVLFVVALSLLLIVMVDRGTAEGATPAVEPRPVDELPTPEPRVAEVPAARAS